MEFSIAEVRVRGADLGSRPPIYEVRLEESESAVALRTAFSSFTRKKDPVRIPPELKGVGVYNSITLATRVRTSILRVSFFLYFISFIVLLRLIFDLVFDSALFDGILLALFLFSVDRYRVQEGLPRQCGLCSGERSTSLPSHQVLGFVVSAFQALWLCGCDQRARSNWGFGLSRPRFQGFWIDYFLC